MTQMLLARVSVHAFTSSPLEREGSNTLEPPLWHLLLHSETDVFPAVVPRQLTDGVDNIFIDVAREVWTTQ